MDYWLKVPNIISSLCVEKTELEDETLILSEKSAAVWISSPTEWMGPDKHRSLEDDLPDWMIILPFSLSLRRIYQTGLSPFNIFTPWISMKRFSSDVGSAVTKCPLSRGWRPLHSSIPSAAGMLVATGLQPTSHTFPPQQKCLNSDPLPFK